MSDPVILIGMSTVGGGLVSVGLFETIEKAQEAVQTGEVVQQHCFYSVITPAMNTVSQTRQAPKISTYGSII